VRETREKTDYSPAELALLDKFQTITEKKAIQEALHKSKNSSKSAEQEKDARQIAIDIIRARRMGSSFPNQAGAGVPPAKKTKIKLMPKKDKVPKSIQEPIVEPEAKKKKKVHVVQVRRRMTAVQKQQQTGPAPSGLHALFIDNIPEYCTSDDLYTYFAEQWSLEVVSAGVYKNCCSGLVTFGSLEDAEYVMNEQQQHECELGGNVLSITWATEDDIKALDMGAAEGPAPVDPRLQQRPKDIQDHSMSQEDDDAQGRNVVSYDDL